MTNRTAEPLVGNDAGLDRALRRIVAEIRDGVRHGYFECTVTCEVIGQERHRVTLKAGRSFQFVISKEGCLSPAGSECDSRNGSDTDAA